MLLASVKSALYNSRHPPFFPAAPPLFFRVLSSKLSKIGHFKGGGFALGFGEGGTTRG
jgi:hypothetical protein